MIKLIEKKSYFTFTFRVVLIHLLPQEEEYSKHNFIVL